MSVIELGGGQNPKFRPNVDRRHGPNVDFVMDFEKPLPFDSNQFDMVYSAYVLEHISWRNVNGFVKEIWRILKPTGKAVIVTANLFEQCRKVVSAKEWSEDFSCLIFGGQDYSENTHKCGFSPDYAVKFFREAGFEEVQVKPHPNSKTDMIVEAHKSKVIELSTATDRVDWVRKHCRRGEKILDVGSAGGHVFQNSDLEPYVTYLDIDLYDFPRFVHLDAHDLVDERKSVIKDDSFDVAVVAEILEHVEDPVKVLKGAGRVAKRLLITVPDPANWNVEYRPYETLSQAIERTGKTPEQLAHKDNPKAVEFYTKDGYEHLFHRRWYTKEMLEDHLKQAGITDYVLNRLAYAGWSFFVVEAKTVTELTQKQITSRKKRKTKIEDKLNIGLISTPFLKTPPSRYGGSEMIVADLGESLAKMGHEVTVFAADGSKVEGCKVVEFGPALENVQVDWLQAERRAYEFYKDKLRDFDIIHSHDWFSFCYASKVSNPALKICHTHHGGLNPDWWCRTKPPFKLNFIAISKWMQKVYAQQGIPSRVVYNGVNLKRYPVSKKRGDRFLFLSRISTFKAPHVAIEVAKKAGVELDVVGATNFVDDPEYVNRVQGMCDGKQIRFVGEVSHEEKLKYLRNARALLVTGRWGEPFGLHVVEALAVGTSVVAFPDGGIAETLKEGGLLCSDVDSMVDAVKQVDGISSKACRRNAERFSRENMAKNYLTLYQNIINGDEW